MLGQGIAATVYYIVSDLRLARLRALQPMHWPQPGAQSQPQPQPFAGYGPGQASGATPYGLPVQPSGPPPMPEQSYRLGQVRAELDELSDYLRKEQDR
jgi:hypothetical protein